TEWSYSPNSYSDLNTSTPHLYTLSLHDALPISTGNHWPHLSVFANDEVDNYRAVIDFARALDSRHDFFFGGNAYGFATHGIAKLDRKSTRLNSSHVSISYAVFCLKKKT